MDFERFLFLLRALEEYTVDYVLVGGVALNMHGIIRATEDIDLFVQPTPENIARLRQALQAIWADPDIDEITAEDLNGEYPAIRYGPPDEDFAIDIISQLGTAFRFEDLQIEIVQIEGVAVRLATPSTLYQMKKNTVRPIDRADSAMLREKFALQNERDERDGEKD